MGSSFSSFWGLRVLGSSGLRFIGLCFRDTRNFWRVKLTKGIMGMVKLANLNMFFKTQELLKQALEMFCQYSQSSPCDNSCNLPAPAMTIRRLYNPV